jgi:hypothetical protein
MIEPQARLFEAEPSNDSERSEVGGRSPSRSQGTSVSNLVDPLPTAYEGAQATVLPVSKSPLDVGEFRRTVHPLPPPYQL